MRIVLSLLGILTVGTLQAQTLRPQQLSKWLEERAQGKRSFLLIDVRTPDEHRQGFIAGTDTLIPLGQWNRSTLSALGIDPEKDTIVVYCRSGHRAGIVQKQLKDMGVRWVFNGLGIRQWIQSGHTLTQKKSTPPSSSSDSQSSRLPDGIVPASRVCMTQDEVYPRDLIPVEVDGETYYGCCPGCASAIQSNPDRYIWAVDPVSGKRVNKAKAVIYSYQGKAYYFESEQNVEVFLKNPETYLQEK